MYLFVPNYCGGKGGGRMKCNGEIYQDFAKWGGVFLGQSLIIMKET